MARTALALTIRFKRASDELIFKYSLSGETLEMNGVERKYNHIFLMPWVTHEQIDRFIHDLSQPGAIAANNPAPEQPAGGEPVKGARQLMYVPHRGRGFR